MFQPSQTSPALAKNLLALAAAFAVAASDAEAGQDGWTYEVAPYLWGAGVSGTAAAAPGFPAVHIDASFSDILSNLDMGAMLAASASKGNFGVFGDLQYVNLGASGATSGGVVAASADIKMLVLSLGVETIVIDSPGSQLRLMAGARRWQVDTDIQISAGPFAGGSTGSNDWWDAMVGLRGRHDIGPRTFLTGWALVGGGGSDFMADVFGGVGYRISDTTSLVGGYRYMTVDRTDGSFIYDVDQQGLLVGLKLSF